MGGTIWLLHLPMPDYDESAAAGAEGAKPKPKPAQVASSTPARGNMSTQDQISAETTASAGTGAD